MAGINAINLNYQPPQLNSTKNTNSTEFEQVYQALDTVETTQSQPTQASKPRVFSGAPDFILSWAEKYNVHILQTAVPLGREGSPTSSSIDPTMKTTVHIHPEALERMINDPEFAAKTEKEIARLTEALQRQQSMGVSTGSIEGTSITIHEDGSITSAMFVDTERNKDTWAMTEQLMKKVDANCRAMSAAVQQKVAKQLDAIQQQRASAEQNRLRVTLSPDLSQETTNTTPVTATVI